MIAIRFWRKGIAVMHGRSVKAYENIGIYLCAQKLLRIF